jgi:acetolactate synthase-1/2/3 large subunit
MNNEIRLADYVIQYLLDLGVDSVFTVTGGGAMFLNDALALNKKIQVICNHHEQASAMAAVAYSKYKNSYGVVILTTGCGATNALTGLLDAWQDNVPCIFISGQSKRKETTLNSKTLLRQFGVQEADIISIVKPITKYAVMINEPTSIKKELDKAVRIAISGRPGPVWIDIPLDVQGAYIQEKQIKSFNAVYLEPSIKIKNEDIEHLKKLLEKSERPIVIAGNGIRLGNAVENFKRFTNAFNIPFVTTYLSLDLLPSNHKLYIGRIGIKGDRPGNFSLQNSDLVISIGCRLSVAVTGFEYKFFAREAKVVVVDIDKNEHKKKTVKISKIIHGDANDFLNQMLAKKIKTNFNFWHDKCKKWKKDWPVYNPDMATEMRKISIYAFIFELSKALKKSNIVVSDAGSAYYATSQGIKLAKNIRYITSGAQADMGFTIPASIGASMANKKAVVIGITGDGSFQMNIQELQTIFHHKMPIKIFILNNNGYLSIRSTQKKFFQGRAIGTDKKSGVSFPDLQRISKAYNIKFSRVKTLCELKKYLKLFNSNKMPEVIEVLCPENEEIIPTVSSKRLLNGDLVSSPLEDMYPFLDRDIFLKNMITKPLKEDV